MKNLNMATVSPGTVRLEIGDRLSGGDNVSGLDVDDRATNFRETRGLAGHSCAETGSSFMTRCVRVTRTSRSSAPRSHPPRLVETGEAEREGVRLTFPVPASPGLG